MIPVYSVKDVRDADSKAIDEIGIDPLVLMENAAVNIFNLLSDIILKSGKNKKICIVCGKGNNGGDGFALARHFLKNGFTVKTVSLFDEDKLSHESLRNFLILKKMTSYYNNSSLKIGTYKDEIKEADFVIDAILGTGTKGSLSEFLCLVIDEINRAEAVKISVDIPSGLDGDTGCAENYVKADYTITLAGYKKGLFINEGVLACGKIIKTDIGIGDEIFKNTGTRMFLIEKSDSKKCLPARIRNMNKYSSGPVMIIAGSGRMPKAAALCANSAMRAGCGSVFLAFPASQKSTILNMLDSAVVIPYDDYGKEILTAENLHEFKGIISKCNTLLIGPGLGRDENTIEAVIRIIEENKNKRIIIDADALFAVASYGFENLDLRNCILTPHMGEFIRLTGKEALVIKKRIFETASDFAQKSKAVLVLKGAPTIIASPEGKIFVNTTGNSGLAKFGSGDVLAGIIAGFSGSSENLLDSVICGVYLHGLCADIMKNELTEYAVSPDDLIKSFYKAILEINE